MTDLAETKTYTGSCHCGAVRFEATMNLERTISCNCSICMKAGYVLAFVPAEQFKLLSGEDKLHDYQFNRKMVHHVFCSVCGIHPFGQGTMPDGKEMRAVNLRCVDNIDLEQLNPQKVDGRSR